MTEPAGSDVAVDRVVVVLAGDLDTPRLDPSNGMVGAVMAEAELERAGSERAAHDLVTEADAEHRYLAEQLADLADCAVDRGGIAGAVGQEHAVGRAGDDRRRRCRRGDHLDVATGRDELAQDRGLDPEVVGDDVERRVGRPDA